MSSAGVAHGRCAPTFLGIQNFFVAAHQLGFDLQGARSMIVNLGAALRMPNPNRFNRYSNHDEAWELFFTGYERGYQFSMVAYEGSAAACDLNELEFNDTRSKFHLTPTMRQRVSMVNQYVSARTIADELQKRGVPRGFLLLKVDIDSLDLAVTKAVVERFQPALVFVEQTTHPVKYTWVDKVPFAALENRQGEPTAHYGGVPGGSRGGWFFLCAGATASAWVSNAPSFGYEVLQWDGDNVVQSRNLLLVQSRDRARFEASKDSSCHQLLHRGEKKATDQDYWTALSKIEAGCARSNTSYRAEYKGECCPKMVGTSSIRLRHCRCEILV